MRVAVVAEGTARHEETDAAVRMRDLGRSLSDRGHDVAVFCAQWWEGDVPEFEADGVSYRAVTGGLDVPDRRFVTRLPSAVRRFDPAVVHAVQTNPVVVHAAGLASALTRTPLLVDWYGLSPASGWREYARVAAARVPDLVVTPSRTVETSVRALGRPEDDVAVIPDSVDMDLIRSVEPDPVADVVYSRRLDGDANLESLLLALAELREVAWEAAVIGDGPERERYEHQASDLRIDDRVEFMGARPVERRLAVFKGAHVAVHTALVAPFPTDFLRALACGCVGIAEYHAASSAHELVEQRRRGFRVTGEDELADAIRSAADIERAEVGEEFASFDEGRTLERYLDAYRRVGAL